MSDSDNTKELDNYGVWVKKEPQTVDSSNQDATFDIEADLPNFDSLESNENMTFDSDDTALSVDELSAITAQNEVVDEGAAASDSADAFAASDAADSGSESMEDISLDEFIEGGVFEDDNVEGNKGMEVSEEAAPSDSSETESVDLSEFGMDDSESQEESPAEETASLASDDSDTLDIDLSFDDDSSAEPAAESLSFDDVAAATDSAPAADDGSESVDLSEFGVDFSEGSSESAAEEPAAEAVQEESAASDSSSDDFDAMFNSLEDGGEGISADAFLSDEDTTAESSSEEAPAETQESSQTEVSADEAESVSLDDFGMEESTEESAPSLAEESSESSESEDISLADFGMDEGTEDAETSVSESEVSESLAASDDIEMTVMTDETESFEQDTTGIADEITEPAFEEPSAEVTEGESIGDVDAFLASPVDSSEIADTIPDTFDEETASLINEGILDEKTEETESAASEPLAAAPAQESAPANEVSTAATQILSQLVGELSALKNEIAGLKSEFESMRHAPAASQDDAIIPADESDSGGFFGDGEEDETISLSTDELDNIMNTADFTESEESDAESAAESAFTEESSSESDDSFVQAFEESENTESTEEKTVIADESAEIADEDIAPTIDDNDEDAAFTPQEIEEEEVQPEEVLSEDSDLLSDIDNSVAVPDDDFTSENNLSMDFNDENLEEPSLDDIETSVVEDNEPSEELPEEITLPKVDDIIVESGSEDLMQEDSPVEADSFAEGETESLEAEEAVEEAESEPVNEESAESESAEEAEEEEDPSQTFDTGFGESVADEITEEGVSVAGEQYPWADENDFVTDAAATDEEEAPAAAETAAESLAEEAPVIEKSLAAPVAEESTPVVETSSAVNGDLKSEIKSVLSYMDQLLENLPEEKIAEFAQSEQYETYKKLFKELGLA